MPPVVTDLTAAALGLSLCLSVTLMHPVKAVEWNETPFGRDTRMVPSNTVWPRGEGRFWGSKPPSCNEDEPADRGVAYCQTTLALIIINVENTKKKMKASCTYDINLYASS